MGSFAAGDQVTVSVWFKAAPGVSGALGIHDGKPTDLNDNKQFLSMAGNGAWQQLTFTHVMTRADALWVDLYGDQFTATSASATAATSVTYDDVQVTSVQRGSVMKEGFESGLNLGTDPTSQSSWYSCGEPTQLASASGAPTQWKRDVIYLGDLAIAEIDADGVHELHSDHLGTPRIITAAATGRVEGRQAYAAFGERIDNPSYTNGYQPLTGYTGHIQTDATGLIYMRGRFYSPAWHRFLNSDHGADPNQAHQFAYAHGSPLELTDYSGFAAGGSAQVGVGDPLADEKEKERAAQTTVEATGGAANGSQVPITTNAQLQAAVQHMLDGSNTLSQIFTGAGINLSDIVITLPHSIPGEAQTSVSETHDSDGKLTGYVVNQIKVDISKIESREVLTDKVAHEIRHAWQFAEVNKGSLSINGNTYSMKDVAGQISMEKLCIRMGNLNDYRRIPIEADAFKFGSTISGAVKW